MLDDIVMPQWEKIQYQIQWKGGKDHPLAEKRYLSSKRKSLLNNGAVVYFRSMDKPNTLRGRELVCYGIDEGRNVPRLGWDRLFDRVRQSGYRHHRGFVTSTPNSYDWMYRLFHEKSKDRGLDPYTDLPFKWYNASTEANKHNLDPKYVASLKANLAGLTLRQEFYGEFVGTTEGAVFPSWVQDKYLKPLYYDPSFPLYTSWDFGIGDPGVCTWLQILPVERIVELETGVEKVWLQKLRVLDAREEADWSSDDWANYYHETARNQFGRSRTNGDYGDPAGAARNVGRKTSVIQDLNTAGVPVVAAQKKPEDFGIRILTNLIEGGRLEVADTEAGTHVSQALAAHKWPLDRNGLRSGAKPVHDWSSHVVATLRYAAASLLRFPARTHEAPPEPTPGPGTVGAALEHLLRPNPGTFIRPGGGDQPNRQWLPGAGIGLGG